MADSMKLRENAVVRVCVNACERIFGKRFKTFVRKSGLVEVLRDTIADHAMTLSARWTIECWNNIEEDIRSEVLRREWMRYGVPQVYDLGYNGVCNDGETIALKLIVGASATAYNNANAFIGVGDSSTAFAETQQGLQAATNKQFNAMNVSYPTTPASGSVDFQSDFTTGQANFAWNEWCVSNGNNPPTTGTMLNRKVQSFGTKVSGTWTLTSSLTAD